VVKKEGTYAPDNLRPLNIITVSATEFAAT
jgi:hypothetical protein